MVIDAAALPAEVRFEAADGDAFPHLFGPLPVLAILRVLELPLAADGSVPEPADFAAAVAACSA